MRELCLAFGARRVFGRLSCVLPGGRLSVLMGTSGSGKSTLLRVIAGLQRADTGEVRIDGVDVTQLDGTGLAALRRRIGMLFQSAALLDSMSIFDNVALPLREHTDHTAGEIGDEVHRRLQQVGLDDVDDLLPSELSGGMLRRAALARAIVMDPELLLCDEPFSGLDPPNVRRIEALLLRINRELGLTVVVTSHHTASALRMADHLVLLSGERAIQGSPAELLAGSDRTVRDFFADEAPT